MAHVYETSARFYDAFSGERVAYRAGRKAGVALLALHAGDTVLDLGCGTGLNLELLVAAVGPTGLVIGLDRSAPMLEMARRRVAANGWSSVRLIEADATTFEPIVVTRELRTASGGLVDAVISTYAMSVFGDWTLAWKRMRTLLKPDGRVCIVDMQLPVGHARIFSPLVRLAARVGGADLTARPWTVLEREGQRVRSLSLRGGHIRVVGASIP